MPPLVNPANINDVAGLGSLLAADAFMLHPCFNLLLDGSFDFGSVLHKLLFGDQRVVSFDKDSFGLLNFGSFEVHADHQVLIIIRDELLLIALVSKLLSVPFIVELNKALL